MTKYASMNISSLSNLASSYQLLQLWHIVHLFVPLIQKGFFQVVIWTFLIFLFLSSLICHALTRGILVINTLFFPTALTQLRNSTQFFSSYATFPSVNKIGNIFLTPRNMRQIIFPYLFVQHIKPICWVFDINHMQILTPHLLEKFCYHLFSVIYNTTCCFPVVNWWDETNIQVFEGIQCINFIFMLGSIF